MNIPITLKALVWGWLISAKWVEMMGGRLQVESTLGKGCRFWFTIECPECQTVNMPLQDHSQTITGYVGTRRRILVVDDKAANRDVLVNMLLPLGFEICEVASGSECLEKAEAFMLDLSLLDLRMPGMDGFEVARRVRHIVSLRNVVVIAVSASAFEDIRDKSRRAGCHDFLAKPFHRVDLLTLL